MTGTAAVRLPGPGAPGSDLSGPGLSGQGLSGQGLPGRDLPRGASRARRVLTSPLVTAVAAVAALTGGAWFGLARAVAEACVHLDGALADVGLRLALVQDVADCPTGTLALVPAPSQGLVLVAALALPVLAASSALGALLAALVAVVLRAVRTARDVLGSVARSLPRAAVVTVAAAPVAPVRTVAHPLPSALARALHPHRGPPVALA